MPAALTIVAVIGASAVGVGLLRRVASGSQARQSPPEITHSDYERAASPDDSSVWFIPEVDTAHGRFRGPLKFASEGGFDGESRELTVIGEDEPVPFTGWLGSYSLCYQETGNETAYARAQRDEHACRTYSSWQGECPACAAGIALPPDASA